MQNITQTRVFAYQRELVCETEIKQCKERVNNGEGTASLYLQLLVELWHIQSDPGGKANIVV
jgi:hypothetical protein